MIKKLISFICLLLISSFSFADEHAKEVNLRHESSFWGGTKIYNGDELLPSRKALKNHLSSDPTALEEFNRSDALHFGASILVSIGGFSIGSVWADSDKSVDTGLLAGGVVATAVGIALGNKSDAYQRSSIDIFNANTTTLSNDVSRLHKVKYRFNLTPSRIGVSVLF